MGIKLAQHKTMFHSARLKLTIFYILISMSISLLFSLSVYTTTSGQFDHFSELSQNEIRTQNNFQNRPAGPPPLTPADIENARTQLITTVIFINAGILIVSSGAGYFLAGRTLMPIKIAMDEQSRFISDASHELKTPITAMRSEIEVYFMDKIHTTKTADTVLASTLEEIVSMQKLTDSLMTLTKYESMDQKSFQHLSILESIEDAIKQVSPMARKKHISIENNFGEEAVDGDQHSLSQLFIILLDNAIKYSPDNTVITIKSQRTDHSVRIDITDQGVGIEKKDLPHLFDRFYRADISRTKQNIDGYGLGLSIAKKIVTHHNGSITVLSKPGKGTTFRIKLPVSRVRA